MSDRQLWSYKEIAAHIRVQPDTVRSYRKHGLLPRPTMWRAASPIGTPKRSAPGWPAAPATEAATRTDPAH